MLPRDENWRKRYHSHLLEYKSSEMSNSTSSVIYLEQLETKYCKGSQGLDSVTSGCHVISLMSWFIILNISQYFCLDFYYYQYLATRTGGRVLLNSLQSPWTLLTVACFHTMSNCPSFKLIFSLRDCSQFLTFPKFSSTLLMSLNSDISQISDPIVSLIIFYQPTS